jgi:hypothetical protein
MDGRKFQFLKAVLGDDGAKALAKAAERAPELGTRSCPGPSWPGWASPAVTTSRAPSPAYENTYLQFTKSEAKYSGSVSVGDEVYSFEAATICISAPAWQWRSALIMSGCAPSGTSSAPRQEHRHSGEGQDPVAELRKMKLGKCSHPRTRAQDRVRE